MHPTDGNTYAIERYLAEREAYEAENPEAVTMYCGACDETIDSHEWPDFIEDETCPECDGPLCDSKSDYEPSEAAQGLVPIPDGYAEA